MGTGGAAVVEHVVHLLDAVLLRLAVQGVRKGGRVVEGLDERVGDAGGNGARDVGKGAGALGFAGAAGDEDEEAGCAV